MQRTKEVVSKEYYKFGVLHSGRRYRRRNIGAEKGESRSEPKWIGTCAIVEIMEIPHIK
jgi:hypothetical protein